MSVYSAPWFTPAVQRILDLALEEDVGRGDATTAAVIDESQEAEAEIVSRERAVVCGLGVVEAVFTRFDWRTRVRSKVADGDRVQPGEVVANSSFEKLQNGSQITISKVKLPSSSSSDTSGSPAQ